MASTVTRIAGMMSARAAGVTGRRPFALRKPVLHSVRQSKLVGEMGTVRTCLGIPAGRGNVMFHDARENLLILAQHRALSTTGTGTGGTSDSEQGRMEAEGETSEEYENKVSELGEELAKAKEALKEAEATTLYIAAEMENVRAIAKRDAEGARLYAVQRFAKQLLDVADNLTRAMESVGEGGAAGGAGSASLESLLEGIAMTDAELQKVFKSQGIVKFGQVGDKFDPHLHDAMFEHDDPTKEAGTLGQVLKPGYKLHDRVIRAAQVGTVKPR